MNKTVARELTAYENSEEELPFTIDPDGDDLTKLRVTLTPPPQTPYEGGVFFLKLTIPPGYPTSPPSIVFETKIWHPNIQEDGTICLEQLKSDWNPSFTLKHAVTFVYSLLENPNWDTPLVTAIGAQHTQDPKKFEEQARAWTAQYAI
jgi:ubiquitin-conjugating enzyme E2 D/E